MPRRFPAVARLTLLLLAFACLTTCGPGAEDPVERTGEPWEGTVSTEGSVTTVVNTRGSVWRGGATLVEEASIGVDIGEDPYMLGRITAVWATDDRIFAVDYDGPSVRVFDFDGKFVMEIGREGEGPGEFRNPNSVVVSSAGLIYVREGFPGGRINVYDPEGNYIETRRGDPMLASAAPMVITDDDVVFTQTRTDQESGSSGMGVAGRDGIEGERLEPPEFTVESASVFVNDRVSLGLPFLPRVTSAMAPSRAMVGGYPAEYRFEIHNPDGTIIVVERSFEPVAVDPDEAEWQRRATIRSGRQFEPGWNWSGDEIPTTKPAYSRLQVDRNGRVWVTRRGAVTRVDDCDPDPLEVTNGRPRPCWVPETTFDVFGDHGKFLGSVETPAEIDDLFGSFIRDDVLIAIVEDPSGTVMVKRYRLVIPSW